MQKHIFIPFTLFIILCISGIFHFSLWDDEANTALMGKVILQTGTLSAQVDEKNFLMYRNGAELKDLYNTYLPPLPALVVAASFRIFGISNWSARIPFLFIGWLGLLALFFFIGQRKTTPKVFPFFIILLLSNVSLALFLSNCRYYALAFTASVIVVIAYLSSARAWLKVGWISFGGVMLAGSNYLNYVALFGVLLFDQAGKLGPRLAINRKQWICLLSSQGAVLLFLGIFFNPFNRQVIANYSRNQLMEKVTLLWWNFRDADAAQFASLPLLLFAGVWSLLKTKEKPRFLLLRGMLAAILYVLIITIFSPQPVRLTSCADIRYLVPLIPLLVFLEAYFLSLLLHEKKKTTLATVALLAFTNVFQLQFYTKKEFRSFFLERVWEIIYPPAEPYAMASRWISSRIIPGQSIWVVPDYMTYPLMFHAPHAVYAWQLRLEQKKEEQFKNLPDIHFKGLVPPDYIVVFGPSVEQIRQLISQWSMQGLRYQEVTRLMTFWKDLYRPELFWRTFKPIEKFDPNTEAIYIFQRQS
jgi:hypothetical protein